jgi:hypothetical protein
MERRPECHLRIATAKNRKMFVVELGPILVAALDHGGGDGGPEMKNARRGGNPPSASVPNANQTL